jgi:hypothetical protein
VNSVTSAPLEVFVAYASDGRELARRVCARLEAAGLRVFLDENVLRRGEGYDREIRAASRGCTAFVFVISPGSVAPDAYALTELRWANQARRLLCGIYVDLAELPPLPPELEAVTVPRPSGDSIAPLVTQVADVVHAQRDLDRRRFRSKVVAGTLLILTMLGGVWLMAAGMKQSTNVRELTAALSEQQERRPAGEARSGLVGAPNAGSTTSDEQSEPWTELASPELEGLDTGKAIRLLAAPLADSVILSWYALGMLQFRRYDFEAALWTTLPVLRVAGEPAQVALFALEPDQLLALWAQKTADAGLYASWYRGQWTNPERIASFLRDDSGWILEMGADSNENGVRIAWSEWPSTSKLRLLRTVHFDGRKWRQPEDVAQPHDRTRPFVAMLESGHSLIAWQSNPPNGPEEISYRLYSEDGSALGAIKRAPGSGKDLLGLETDEAASVELLYGGTGELATCSFTVREGWQPCASVLPESMMDATLTAGSTDGVVWDKSGGAAPHIGVATREQDGRWAPVQLDKRTVAFPQPTLFRAGRALHALWLGYEPAPNELGYVGWARYTPDARWSGVQRIAQQARLVPVRLNAVGTSRGRALAVVSYADRPASQEIRPSVTRKAVFAYQ